MEVWANFLGNLDDALIQIQLKTKTTTIFKKLPQHSCTSCFVHFNSFAQLVITDNSLINPVNWMNRIRVQLICISPNLHSFINPLLIPSVLLIYQFTRACIITMSCSILLFRLWGASTKTSLGVLYNPGDVQVEGMTPKDPLFWCAMNYKNSLCMVASNHGNVYLMKISVPPDERKHRMKKLRRRERKYKVLAEKLVEDVISRAITTLTKHELSIILETDWIILTLIFNTTLAYWEKTLLA